MSDYLNKINKNDTDYPIFDNRIGDFDVLAAGVPEDQAFISIGRTSTDSGLEGRGSVAIGESASAKGSGAHSEGKNTAANGRYGYAFGNSVAADGDYSHAEGNNVTASADYQHVQGKFNVDGARYIDIIGYGSDSNHKKNLEATDFNGNKYLAGNVYVESGPDGYNGTKLIKEQLSKPYGSGFLTARPQGLHKAMAQYATSFTDPLPITYITGYKITSELNENDSYSIGSNDIYWDYCGDLFSGKIQERAQIGDILLIGIGASDTYQIYHSNDLHIFAYGYNINNQISIDITEIEEKIPKIIYSNIDIGEGAELETGKFYFVYE